MSLEFMGLAFYLSAPKQSFQSVHFKLSSTSLGAILNDPEKLPEDMWGTIMSFSSSEGKEVITGLCLVERRLLYIHST